MKLAPYVKYLMQFAMPDNGGPAAGGGGGGGGGGPAAPTAPAAAPTKPGAPPAPSTIEPPDPVPTPPRTDAQKEIDDFAPPEFDDDEPPVDPAAPKPGAKPDPKAPDPKPADKKEAPPAPKPGDKPNPEDDPKVGAAPLRAELKTIRKERDELKAAAAKGDPKLPVVTQELEDLKKVRDEILGENDRLRSQLAIHDPALAGEITKMDTEFNAKFERATKLLPKLRTNIGALVGEFRSLPTEKYEEALEAFETKVAGVVGQNRVAEAMRLIQEGAEFFETREGKMKDLRENGVKLQSAAQQKAYTEGVSLMADDVKDALVIPDDLKNAHPYHPLAYANTLIEGLDDAGKAKFGEFIKSVEKYTTYAAQGISPETMNEFAKMEPKEREAAIRAFNDKRRSAIKTSRQMIVRAYVYEKLFSGVLKQYAAMREKLQKLTGGAPPDPNKTPGGGGGNGDDKLDNFRAEIPEL